MKIKNEDDPNLYTDSGATTHMLNDTDKLIKLAPYKEKNKILFGNGDYLGISHTGEGKIKTEYGSLRLKNVLVVPHIAKNLIFV